MTREACSHECSSVDYRPGNSIFPAPAFYAFTAPAPIHLGEFLLPYHAVPSAAEPRKTLMGFVQSTHEGGADLAHWDREALQRPEHVG